LPFYPDAIHLHFEVTVFHTKATSNLAVVTVVVGSATAPASNDVPQVIALAAVPVIAIQSFCPSVGVPERLVVNEVIASVCAVRE
jgi:hypothetical protein